jgi:N-acetylglucosamine kinase-like BadF-type ATPase
VSPVPPSTILAVDGGNSKVDVALVDTLGRLLAAARLRGHDHDGAGSDSHLSFVARAIESALSTVNGARTGQVADIGVYCLAGVDFDPDIDRITAWLESHGWTSKSYLHNDTFAVLRAGSERTWGVAVVCGHGTNCSGVAPDGRTFRLPAIGPISGDWGGGLDIGLSALWHAVRAEDGRGPQTALTEIVPVHFGLQRPADVTEAIHFGRLARSRLAELASLVFKASRNADAIARDIIDRQADEIATMAGAAVKHLEMSHMDVDVVLGGGIFRVDDHTFFTRIRDQLEAVCPRVRLNVLATPPVVGAALLGIHQRGTSNGVEAKIRSVLTHEALERSLNARESSWRRSSSNK